MMVVSIDPNAGTATMISFPRDLYMYIPGWRVDRINTADARGGFEMTCLTILYNFGIELDGYVRAEFTGFVAAIDTLGGITVESTGNLKDECGGEGRSYSSGPYDMDGFEALCYVRMRKTSEDFDRLRRQQEVIQAIFGKLISIDGLSRMPELYDQFSNMLWTDIQVIDLLPLVPTGVLIGTDSSRIQHFSVDRSMASSWRTPSGGSVQLPNREAIHDMLLEAFAPEAVSNP